MGIGITSNDMQSLALYCSQLFQSPMGIGITSNPILLYALANSLLFQSPMGIGITSNSGCSEDRIDSPNVSIPNGDRHYLELALSLLPLGGIDLSFNPQWG